MKEYDIVIGSIDKKDQIFHEDGDLYSQVGFVVTIKRHFRAFLMEYFIPCFAMVLVSFVSFTIPADAIPGRVALLVTVFLVLSTFFGDIQVIFVSENTEIIKLKLGCQSPTHPSRMD